MKKFFIVGLIFYALLCYANIYAEEKPFPPVVWTSKSSSDTITIENGTGALLTIFITVDNPGTEHPNGINIKNCGSTNYIAPGSTGVCLVNDRTNPVNFSSESGDTSRPVSGTYQIKAQ